MASTNKQPQILQLNPSNEIIFEGPFEHVVTSYLELKNPTDRRVCFKVKTTAPRRYCVRPNSGIVPPGGRLRIAIMLQPIEQDSQTERNKHKFMVQSILLPEGDQNKVDLDSVWQTATPGDIMDSKLRCIFQTPNSSTEPATANTTSTQQQLQQKTNEAPTTTTTATTTSSTTIQAATTTNTQQQQPQTTEGSQKLQLAAGDGQSRPKASDQPSTSTPSTPPRHYRLNQFDNSPKKISDAEKSIASSHNLTASFLQPMSDDYKIVLVSLAMLFIGVILGKYII